MAIIIKTNNPSQLLSSIKKAIDDRVIETWSYDDAGDFTHTPAQYIRKAWFTSRIYNSGLRFGLLGEKNVVMSVFLYGLYHGRFIEMLLMHFDMLFSFVSATSDKSEPDVFSSN